MAELDKKQDHFVPKLYLKRFHVPGEPCKLYAFDKQKARVVKSTISKVERSRHAHTTKADSILQKFENTWARILDCLGEEDVDRLNEYLIDRQASAPLRSWLARFVVISATRSRGLRARMSDELEEARAGMVDFIEELSSDLLRSSPDRVKEMQRYDQAICEATNVNSKRKWQARMVDPFLRGEEGEQFYRLYEEGSWRFYPAADERRFITSDTPSLSLLLGAEPEYRDSISFVMPLTDKLQLTGWCGDLRSANGLAPTVDSLGQEGMDLANVCVYRNAHRYVYASSTLEIGRAVAKFNANPW